MMKYRDRASQADHDYQLAREEEVMDDYERRQREIEQILAGRRPGVPPVFWVLVAAWAVSVGGVAWAVTRWLWN